MAYKFLNKIKIKFNKKIRKKLLKSEHKLKLKNGLLSIAPVEVNFTRYIKINT